MACHVIAKVHRIIKIASGAVRICASLFLFYVRSRDDLTEIICEEDS